MSDLNLTGNTPNVDSLKIVTGPTGTALTVQPLFQAGSAAPTHTAAKGTLYTNTGGSSTSTRLYVNTDGGTTWTNVTTAA